MIKTAPLTANKWLPNTSALHRSGGVILLLLLLVGSASAQSVKGTAGSTPSGLAPGAAAGSYRLSDFDSINVYNGNVSFHLPLLGIGGRGGAQIQLQLSKNNPKWGVVRTPSCGECDADLATPVKAKEEIEPPLGPGTFKVLRPTTGSGANQANLTKMVFIASDGTEYELRDKVSNGDPKYNFELSSPSFNRGAIFVSSDGTATTFISTDASGSYPVDIYDGADVPVHGYLMLRDGTRFWVQSTTGATPTPQIKWMRDRNGNLLKFDYNNLNLVKITDSLNRVVNISYSSPITINGVSYSLLTTITYKGFNGSLKTLIIEKAYLSDYALRDDYVTNDAHHGVRTYGQLFHELVPYWDLTPPTTEFHDPDEYFDPIVPRAVILPDGRSYQLRYNRYGELARVEVPTGGAVEYNYTTGSGVVGMEPGMDKEIYRRVKQRRVEGRRLLTDNVVTEQVTNYGDPVVTGVYTDTATTSVTVTNAAALENHFFHGDPIYYRVNGRTAISYGRWNEGREYKTEVYTPDGTTLLRKVENTWRNRVWLTSSHDDEPPNDPLLVETVTTLGDDGATNHLTTKRTSINPQTGALAYDAYCNPTDVWEYAYGAGSPGPLLRHTHTEYLTTNSNQEGKNYAVFDSLNDIHLRSLVVKQQVFQVVGGSEIEQARITYEYDKYGGDNNHAALVARSNISGHDADFSSTYQTRGNLTATTRWLLPNQPISSYLQYDVAGNTVKAIDALGNAATLSYTDNFGAPDGAARTSESPLPTELGSQKSYAFATHVTNALGHEAYTQYNYHMGAAVDTEDTNGVVTSAYYGGALDRPTKVVSDANNLAAKRQTSFTYLDSAHTIGSTSDLNTYGDNKLKGEAVYDDLGRTVETRSYEGGANYIRVEQKYDSLGRAYKASNPYRPYLAETALWTTNSYDALGRVTSVKTPDNAIISTAYSGNLVEVTDQAGKDRQSTTDALGRLTKVVEDPDTEGLKYTTQYTYDAMDNLLTVTQGAQTRTLVYDSLSRLKSAENPENGTITYEYDHNGNLKKRTDERKISATSQVDVAVTYTYDNLNRIKTKSYNDGTPAVAYFYDAEGLPSGAPAAPDFLRGASTGRLVAVTYGGTSAGSYFGYDHTGRVTRSAQRTNGTNYALSYQYNLAGGLTAETYPSGRVVRTAYDGIGRLSTVTGEKNGLTRTYASGFGYNSQGALSKLKLGNGLWEHTTYDPKRFQVKEIGLGTSALDSSQLKLTYSYGAATANNGDVSTQTITAPALSLTQSFTYDELNRLSSATEKKGTTIQWRQSFTYDQYGNRRVDETTTTPALVGQNPTVSAVNNRINGAGYQYDPAGNMTRDQLSNIYQYDGESRLVSYTATTSSAAYQYDGAGQRVSKVTGTGSLAVTTTFIYDAGGSLIAEYATNATGSETGTSYLTLDRLGSTRLVTNGVIASGNQTVKARYDYLPFGAEIAASYGNRSSVAGYTVNQSTRQKFTGYERDIETGLDFAQARYYANTQGRFISADSVGGSALNPQTLNRYAYTGNNPLNNIDPSGHVFFGANFSSSQSYGNEAPAGYPDYNEAGLLSGEVEKFISLKVMRRNDSGAADATTDGASAGSTSTIALHEQSHADSMNEQPSAPQDTQQGDPNNICDTKVYWEYMAGEMNRIAKSVGGKFDPEKFVITGLYNVSYKDAAKRFKNSGGFTPFVSPNSNHPGANFMKQINNERWYHVTVEPQFHTVTYPGGVKNREPVPNYQDKLPGRITIHCDQHKPNTFEHLRKDFLGLPF